MLVVLISGMKVLELHTDQYYASRLIFGSSTVAVGVLLSTCCVAISRDLWNDRTLGLGGEPEEVSLEDPLVFATDADLV